MNGNPDKQNEFKEVQIVDNADPNIYQVYNTPVPPQGYYAQPAFVHGDQGNYGNPNQGITYVAQGAPNVYENNQNYPPNNYPPNNYPPNNYAPQIINVVNPMVPIQVIQNNQIELFDDYEKMIFKYSRWARYVSLANFVLDLLIMVGVPFLFFIIGLNLLGYFGARKYHKCMSVGYLVYLGIIILLKIFVMIVYPYPVVVAIYLILIILECFIGFVFLLYTIKLFKTSEAQLEHLRLYHSQQANTGCLCFYL